MTWRDGAAGRSSAMPDVWLSVHMPGWASDADAEILPIEPPAWCFYRLAP